MSLVHVPALPVEPMRPACFARLVPPVPAPPPPSLPACALIPPIHDERLGAPRDPWAIRDPVDRGQW